MRMILEMTYKTMIQGIDDPHPEGSSSEKLVFLSVDV